jgi:voltage-gated potassium channel Kch
VSANLSADTRQGVINIAGSTHTVTQLGYTATLSPTTATVTLTGGVTNESIIVRTLARCLLSHAACKRLEIQTAGS